MVKNPPVVDLPDEVWQDTEFTSIHCTVLIACFKDVAAVVSELPPAKFDSLIDSFHESVLTLVDELKHSGFPIGEVKLSGTRVRICFFDSAEVQWNYQLDGADPVVGSVRQAIIRKCKAIKESLVFNALRTAIILKDRWLAREFNIERVKDHLEHWELSIGVHCGRVFLRERADGEVRIEGGLLELSEKVIPLIPKPMYSHIIFSQRAKDYLLRMVLGHTQMRKRVFFVDHQLDDTYLKGFTGANCVSELKFFHRIEPSLSSEEVAPFEALFALNRGNRWAYNRLADYHGYKNKQWMKMFAFSKKALMVHPGDEKILLDMANAYLEIDKPFLAQKCIEESLVTNPSFDLAFEMLSRIAQTQDDIKTSIKHYRNAMYLSPDSAVNSFNLGLALLEDNQTNEGYFFIEDALRTFPGYVDNPVFSETLADLRRKGKLPNNLEMYLDFLRDEETEK